MRQWLHSVRLRLSAMLRREQLERDLQDEIAYHQELRAAHGGRSVPFGNATAIAEICRDTWSFQWLEDMTRDTRHAFRTMRQSPGHTLAIVLLLAAGIGANSAIFSIAYPVLLQQLAVPEPERLVTFDPYLVTEARPGDDWSMPLFEAFREQYLSADVAAIGGGFDADQPGLENLPPTLVSGNFFQVLGVRAEFGRVLAPDDDRFADPNLAFVLSHAAWLRELGGDPSAIGRQFTLFGRQFTLVGVLPPEFRGLGGDLWVPLNLQPVAVAGPDRRRDSGHTFLHVLGRLKPGVSREQAQAEASAVWTGMTDLKLTQRTSVRVGEGSRGFTALRDRYQTPLQILTAAVAMLLLIACANVASLLLARAGARHREIAVRQAMGCSRGRLLRQFLVESLVLAVCGGLLGLALAETGARMLVAFAAPEALGDVDPGLNLPVVLFTLAVSFAAAILFGLAPAWRASHVAIEPALKIAARGAAGDRSRHWLNRACVVAQTALSVILVATAALFGQSLYRLYSMDAGFQREHVITASLNSRALGYQSNPDPQYAAAAARIQDRLEALPGVTSASVTGTGFLQNSSRWTFLMVEGHESQPSPRPIRVNQATWNFLDTLGVPLLAGRKFTALDRAGAPAVAIVNQTFARTYFPGAIAVGKRLWRDPNRTQAVEIIGVAADSKYNDLREETEPLVFLPLAQDPRNFNHVQLRVQGPAEALLPLVSAAILEVDPRLDPRRVETLSASLDRTLARDILLARLSGLFGILALTVACFGVYGMIAYLVASRRTEIGVRLAIGAQPSQVLREVIGDALRIALPGVVLGIAGAFALQRLIESLLFEADGSEAPVYALVAICLVLTTILAAFWPARRASRIDPVNALRCD